MKKKVYLFLLLILCIALLYIKITGQNQIRTDKSNSASPAGSPAPKSKSVKTPQKKEEGKVKDQTPKPVFTSEPLNESIKNRIAGLSYPSGCKVPYEDLRYLKVSYVDFEGRTQTGEMICNKTVAEDLTDIFQKLYEARYPIEKIRLIDEYGADDEKSMADNNSSSFCYRTISGSNKISKHGYGLAVDINPLYNPYVVPAGNSNKVEPANAVPYTDRSKAFSYKIDRSDLCYRLFIEHGFTWGGDWNTRKDYQHFEK